MRRTLPIFFTLLLLRASAHDFQVSFFEVGTSSEGQVSLFIRLDKEDILKELYASCEDYSQVNKCLEIYVNEHFTLSFDGQGAAFSVVELKHTKEFVEINLISSTSVSIVKQIEVFNDVLVDTKPSQENIVRFSINDQERSFRMNKDRTKTTITY